MSNNGMPSIKLHIKTDQEPSIINVQIAMQELCPDRIICLNSPVGELKCNGRVENAMRRVQENVRAFRHHVEWKIKAKIFDDAPVMSWVVRWAAELSSKYVVGEDGRTHYKRIRQDECVTFPVPSGEVVMYLQFKTVHRHKGTPAKKMGVRLRASERSEEVQIGTKYGVVKCRIVNRLDEDERWSKAGILEMRGALWEPVFGKHNQHILADVADNGDHMGFDSENEEAKADVSDDEAFEKIITPKPTSSMCPRKRSRGAALPPG